MVLAFSCHNRDIVINLSHIKGFLQTTFCWWEVVVVPIMPSRRWATPIITHWQIGNSPKRGEGGGQWDGDNYNNPQLYCTYIYSFPFKYPLQKKGDPFLQWMAASGAGFSTMQAWTRTKGAGCSSAERLAGTQRDSDKCRKLISRLTHLPNSILNTSLPWKATLKGTHFNPPHLQISPILSKNHAHNHT